MASAGRYSLPFLACNRSLLSGTPPWIYRTSCCSLHGTDEVVSIDREIEARSPDIGLAIAPGPDGSVWRLDHETEVKDLLGHLALGADADSADAMATVLALFQSGGAGERALLRPPELIGGLGIDNAIVSAMHAPRLAATGEGSVDGDWSLVFWSLASATVVGAPIRSVLHRWTVTSQAGELAWWSRPEWASS